MEEIEAKFLNVNISELEDKLLFIGAKKTGETLSRVTCFDYPDYRLKKKNAWVRLRTEFGETTVAYKERFGVSSQDGSTRDAGMKEIETSVGDFDATHEFLLAVGLIEKFSQERRRIRWQKGSVSFDIDSWPLIPPYLEIEADSWEEVEQAAKELSLNYAEHLRCSAHNIFLKYGFDEHEYFVFTFEKQIKKDLS